MSSQPTRDHLLWQFEDAWRRLQGWLEGLTEAEFNWRPTENVWHLEERDGRWTIPYSWIPPEPAPFTTIAWRLAHLATSKVLTLEYAFGEGKKKLADLDLPPDVAGMADYLSQSHTALVGAVVALTDADLPELRLAEWGEQRVTAQILGSAILHDVEHGAQIAALREMYRHRI